VIFIIFAQPAIAPHPGDGAFDVSTIMLSSRHCLSRSYGITYLLDDIRLPLSGVTLLVGNVGRRATGSGSHSLLAGCTAVSGVQAQPHAPRRPTVCSAHASGLGAPHVCATDAALSLICLTHALSPTTTTRARARADIAPDGRPLYHPAATGGRCGTPPRGAALAVHALPGAVRSCGVLCDGRPGRQAVR
jgi:hypothetical protein